MLCGLGVPSLRSLWGAVRNRQLYILRMYCKGWISFNFSIFFIIYTTYSKKKKITRLTAKKKNSIFFYNSHDLQQKKKITRIYSKKKKITRLYGFFVHDLHFSLLRRPTCPKPGCWCSTSPAPHHGCLAWGPGTMRAASSATRKGPWASPRTLSCWRSVTS